MIINNQTPIQSSESVSSTAFSLLATMADHDFNAAPSQFNFSNNNYYSPFGANPHNQGYPMSTLYGMHINVYNDQFINTFNADHNNAHILWDYTTQIATPVDTVTPAPSMIQSAPADFSVNLIPPMLTLPAPGAIAHTTSHITGGRHLLEAMGSQVPHEVTLPAVPAPGNLLAPPLHFCSCGE